MLHSGDGTRIFPLRSVECAMDTVNLQQAKTSLSALVERASHGEEIVIAKAGRPMARLVPFAQKPSGARKLGIWAGRVRIGDDFDDPLPDEIQQAFEGRMS